MTMERSTVDTLAGGTARLDHVAHAVRSIVSVLPLYVELLGGQFLRGGANQHFGYTGAQFAMPAGGCIEVIEPLPGSHFLDSFFRRNSDGGLHHVTFLVDSVEEVAGAAERAGYEVVATNYGALRQEAFLHPRSTSGVLIQITAGTGAAKDGPTSLAELLEPNLPA
jgi:methylmalonyl-CoA/ethylmalonyl-CoA epimerase